MVVVDRNDPVRVQQAVRWNLFQLCQASWRAEGAGIPAKGLTGDAYDGHYFWDTEAYVLPFLAYTQPRIARNLLRFRHSMLPKARERAAVLDLRGALFPWRTINGDEASALYQAGTAQYHLNADIAYAIRRYVDVRGDVEFLAEVGAEILVETARMWEDLGFYGDDGRFHIHGVTGPDEYTTVVNDNAFTNLMARLNLSYAASAVRLLEQESPELLRRPAFRARASSRPRSGRGSGRPRRCSSPTTRSAASPRRTTRSSSGSAGTSRARRRRSSRCCSTTTRSTIYRHQVLKQADVVMAMFLLGNEFTLEQKRRNFDVLRPAHHRRLVAVGLHPEHRRRRDRRLRAPPADTSTTRCSWTWRRRRQRVRRRAHRLRSRGLDGARVRLRRRA